MKEVYSSIYFFLKSHAIVLLIFIIGLILRIWAAFLDPFLHDWDERFHALVARNMMHHPFQPMLRANPINNNYDPTQWCCSHIWLHKPPLFLWQMGLSMKTIGVSLFSMRLPSVLMGSIMILLLYRIAFLCTGEKRIALIAALLLAFSNFQLQMIAGIKGMDHNDIAFGFYVLSGLWAYSEYLKNPTLLWGILIGVLSGFAILNKWLIGLLPYLGWGVNILLQSDKQLLKKEINYLIKSVLVCCVIFLPWQIYTWLTFPDLARFEQSYNWRHITEALEGHSGSVFYYAEHFSDFFGHWVYYLIPIGIILMLRDSSVNQRLLRAFLVESLFVLCFFSFIVKTKVDAHFFFVAPIFLLFLATAIYKSIQLKFIRDYSLILISIIIYFVLNPIYFSTHISNKNKVRNDRIFNTYIYQHLNEYIPDSSLVINMNAFEDIDVMFFNNKMTAYHFTLPEEDMQDLIQKKIPIYAFTPHGKYKFPEWIECYPYLKVINLKLRTSAL
ncbi:MAG: glycosyltransferase family 39 protein [Saprospiraceae bacterium]